MAFYNATDGPNWVNSENWLTDTPMEEWYGVDTDASGRVVRLELAGELDQETQEWDTHGLAGAIPPELGGLANLETLSLARNDLTGSIPPELGQRIANGLNPGRRSRKSNQGCTICASCLCTGPCWTVPRKRENRIGYGGNSRARAVPSLKR